MNEYEALRRLRHEHDQLQVLLSQRTATVENFVAASAQGNRSDIAEPLTSHGEEAAITRQLESRLAAIERAEVRLAAGTYGRSILSGHVIAPERLEADPAAEFTAEEAASLR